MAWEEDYEYSNGACGSCQTCGAATEQEWHAYCAACYRREQGWPEPDDDDGYERPDPPAAASYSLQYKLGWQAGYEAGYRAALERGAA